MDLALLLQRQEWRLILQVPLPQTLRFRSSEFRAVRKNLGGIDALLSTVQMPSGIPVATVAVNGGANAALLSAQILAVEDSGLAEKLDAKENQT